MTISQRREVRAAWALCILLFLAVMLGVGVAAYYFWFEPPWLSYPDQPFPTLASQYRVGDEVKLYVVRRSTASSERFYNISRSIVCHSTDQETLVSSTTVKVRPGVTRAISPGIRITPDIKPGTCHIEGLAQLDGTVRNDLQLTWRSTDFEVVE